jgi:hypothetical protein
MEGEDKDFMTQAEIEHLFTSVYEDKDRESAAKQEKEQKGFKMWYEKDEDKPDHIHKYTY